MSSIFENIFDSTAETTSVGMFLLCILVSLICGICYTFSYSIKNEVSKSMKFSLMLLPSVIGVVILMVSGNIGVGVAIAGAFSLVRFRSAQGTAKEITVIFMAMCSGLIVGVGYLAYAVLFTVVMCVLLILFNLYERKVAPKDQMILKMTVPEDLDYRKELDEVFASYAKEYHLQSVKTGNLGSIFKLTYEVKLSDQSQEKDFIDALRVKNGNLEIALLPKESADNEL